MNVTVFEKFTLQDFISSPTKLVDQRGVRKFHSQKFKVSSWNFKSSKSSDEHKLCVCTLIDAYFCSAGSKASPEATNIQLKIKMK